MRQREQGRLPVARGDGRASMLRPRDPAERLIVALDVPELTSARRLIDRLCPLVSWFKIGLELYSAAGPEALRAVTEGGGKVFVDLKLHDIPHTVAGAVRALARLGAHLLTVHAWGGAAMLRAAQLQSEGEAAENPAAEGPAILGVTVLTSLEQEDLRALGVRREVRGQVVALARQCLAAGLDGCVASPREVEILRHRLGPEMLIVTPGIRPAGGEGYGPPRDDQRRVATPAQAVAAGADWVVVGRPIVQASDPREAARRVIAEIEEAVQRKQATGRGWA